MGKSPIDYAKFFIYLTHWGFILCTIQAIMAAFMVTFKLQELRGVNTGNLIIGFQFKNFMTIFMH